MLPSASAGWEEIEEFALTFNGYKANGSFGACAEIANSHRHESLTNLQTFLFFEQRRWRHFGDEPDEEAMEYIRTLLTMIRNRVAEGRVD